MKRKLLLFLFVIIVMGDNANAQLVAGGFDHVIAVCNSGTVQAWGGNTYGQIGNGTTTTTGCDCIPTPTQVNSLAGIIAVSAGAEFSLALKSDSTVWSWGKNISGQLGDGTNATRTSPVQVNNLSGIIAISAGSGHGLALKADGTVWAWGGNNGGQLGDSTTTDRNTPAQVLGISSIISISAGGHSLAVKSDGTVWGWGSNSFGQLGDGTILNKIYPVQVNNLTGIVSVAASQGSFAHSLALKNDGTVWACGENMYGQLGNGTFDNNPHPNPTQISTLSGIIAVAAGQRHSMALKNNGNVYAWGQNLYGTLGDGTLVSNRSSPVLINSINGIYQIACVLNNSIALKSDGTLWISGENNRGTLGLGTSDSFNHTTYVQATGACILPAGTEEYFSEMDFFVFPNPLEDITTINFGSQITATKIEVHNALGEKILCQKIMGEKAEINLSNQPNGIYFVTARDEKNNLVVKKIVKM